MAYRNPLFGAEPYEEASSQGNESKLASPDELKAFYQDMEKREREQQLERKASRRKSVFSRNRSAKTTPSGNPAVSRGPESEPPSLETPNIASTATHSGQKLEETHDEMDTLERNEKNDLVANNLPAARSIIPDTLQELPAWYTHDDWASTTSFRVKFPIHNPVGPRYYHNHHLIPPSLYRPGARPPSIFSPSFPAMGTNSMPERLDESIRMPGPSRTPSHSPLPTPNSSQTRVADLGIKPRSRKTSQTAHDNVDLLDVSDPWGTNWHHESPYDIGLGSTGPMVPDADPSRSRRSSMTTQARRKTVTPSPLSQSTSAIHLQAPLAEGSHLPRKLSKRRGLSGIFGSYGKSHTLDSHSLPHSPVRDIPSNSSPSHDDRSKRTSTLPPGPPPSNRSLSSLKKERRGSILGRLTKRFSVTRKQPNGVLPHTEVDSSEVRAALNKSPEKLSKRIPAPFLDNAQVEGPHKAVQDADRRSTISIDTSFPAAGTLMVANPDAPSSEISTPPQNEAPLPADSPDSQHRRSAERRYSNAQLHPSIFVTYLSSPSLSVSEPRIAPTSLEQSLSNRHAESEKKNSFQGNRASNLSSSGKQSLENKPLPRPSDVGGSHLPSDGYRSLENRRPSSPTHGPPPPSSTTKPIPLPDVSAAPPPPSSTTKLIPLPDSFAPIPPSATTKPIPLPNMTKVSFPPNDAVLHSSAQLSVAQANVDDSPLSAASMLANPPTPNVADDTPIPAPETRPSVSREPSPGISSVTVRETETFKLIRTKSGNVQRAGETIPAVGEQWEVVEGVSPTKMASKSKEQDRSSSSRSDWEHVESRERDLRRESRKQEATDVSERRRKRSSKSHSHGQHSVDDLLYTQTSYNDRPLDRSSSLEANQRADEVRSGRSRDSRRRSSRKISGSHSASPTKAPSVPARPLERASSKSTRPTSEVPSAADLNALRAREAWEMERLYKGRSMYGIEQNDQTVVPVPAVPATTSKHDVAIHGSSHTSFVMQNFGSQGSSMTQIYHSIPAQPPTTSLPAPSASRTVTASTSPLTASASDILSLPRLSNPLPEPPRETLTPTRISQTFSDSNTAKNGRPSEYWTSYAEVPTAY
ncbi:hypothetical protein D9757_005426 [Collybiopsis confluens]|uniref:Uncharacterized protein n=1 Tax=Collybiopsis confluens TaxID=2823264 RepID=A0A8H5HLX3_9AGAR|nr:hypothetical protein D9757_005426 [Collybiopsis confluens]